MSDKELYDVIVIGGGPAGLTAGLYLSRAHYRALVVEKEKFGGQITITSEVVNYPGVLRTDGKALTETMRRQAEGFGAEFLLAEVNRLETEGDIKTVYTSRGEYHCFGILLATGAHPRMVGFEGEEEFRGHGVAYCATCDGEFFTGKEVFVVGGGFAAAEESVFLTKYASHVTILIRGNDFTCAEAAAEGARNNEKITVLTNTRVVRAEGGAFLTKLVYENTKTGEVTEYHAKDGDTFGIFVFAGYEPETALLKGKAGLDERGYVVTDQNQKTTLDGVYAAGDVCIKSLRQVVTAVGDGATAATELERYASEMQKKTGRKPEFQGGTGGASGAAGVGSASGVRNAGGDSSTAAAHAGNAGAQSIGNAGAYTGNAGAQGQGNPVSGAASAGQNSDGGVFSPDILAQLDAVFSRMENPLILKLYLDERPISAELRQYMEAMAARTEKLTVEIAEAGSGKSTGNAKKASDSETDKTVSGTALGAALDTAMETPCVRILRADGTETGLAFHGVPGGHEFTSFVLGLYNASGPGQKIDGGDLARIRAIDRDIHLKILVSLSCTMCPELVTAAQKIAAESPHVTAEVYDLNHFPDYKDKYHVMSVPCMVTADNQVSFGKKNLPQLLDFLGV